MEQDTWRHLRVEGRYDTLEAQTIAESLAEVTLPVISPCEALIAYIIVVH